MNLEQLKKSAYSHHKVTEAIVQKIVNISSYTPVFFPIIVRKGYKVGCIVNASKRSAPNMDYVSESRYFCRKIFSGILLEKIGKNDATAYAFGGPDSSATLRFDPTRGSKHPLHMT